MPWNGDLSRMDRLVTNLGRLARVPSQAAALSAERILALIEDEFDQGHDPYGNEWAPLSEATIAKGRKPPPLTDTGAMRASVGAAPLPGAGFAIVIDHPAQVHQTGGNDPARHWSMPARPVLPDRAFPPEWEDAIGDAIAETVGGTIQGAA